MTNRAQAATIRQLEDGLDRWGSQLESWPAGERSAAEQLLASSDEARTIFEAARRVDAALAGLMARETEPARLVVRQPPPRRRPSPLRLATWGSVGLAASLLLGFVLGTTLPPPDDDEGVLFLAVQDTDNSDGGTL